MKIVYFTKTGNCRKIASLIADELCIPAYEIAPKEAYPSDMGELSTIAKNELEMGFKRGIKPIQMEKGESVYLVFPSWYRRPPMPIMSFLEEYQPKEVFAIVSCYEDTNLCDLVLKGKCEKLKVVSIKEGHESDILKRL